MVSCRCPYRLQVKLVDPWAHAPAAASAVAVVVGPVVAVRVSAVAAVGPVRDELVPRHVHLSAVAAAPVFPDAQPALHAPVFPDAELELHAPEVLHAFVLLAVARVAELQPEPVRLAVRRGRVHARRAPGISVPSHDLKQCSRAWFSADPAGTAVMLVSCS